MRLLGAIIFGAVLSGCYVPGRGYAESQFDLVLDSRLPKFFDPAGRISPVGYKARVEYYSSPDSVRVIIRDPSGHTVFDKQDKFQWHPFADKEHPAAHYPSYVVVSFDGISDILEQRRLEPLLYLTGDKRVWDALKNGI